MIKLYNFDELKPEEILNRDIREEKNVGIKGVETNIDYQYSILNHPDFISGNIDVEFVTEAKGLLA